MKTKPTTTFCSHTSTLLIGHVMWQSFVWVIFIAGFLDAFSLLIHSMFGEFFSQAFGGCEYSGNKGQTARAMESSPSWLEGIGDRKRRKFAFWWCVFPTFLLEQRDVCWGRGLIFLFFIKFYLACLSVAKIHDFKHFIISKSLCSDEIALRNASKTYREGNAVDVSRVIFKTTLVPFLLSPPFLSRNFWLLSKLQGPV